MKSVVLDKLSKRFGPQVILDEVSYVFPSKGLIAIVGDSGSGKTSLLEIIDGLDVDYTGKVLVLGHSLKDMDEEARGCFRLRSIGYIRQNFDLLELENGYSNVSLPLDALYEDPKELKKRKILGLFSSFGISGKEKQVTNTCSGGEKQRIASARALVNEAKILLCDEPTGALDEENADKMYQLLLSLAEKRLVIIVSHDEKRVLRYANGIIRLQNGKFLVEAGQSSGADEGTVIPKSQTEKEKPSVPPLTWLKHGVHLNRARKWRSLLSHLIISFSLISLSLSLFITRDLGKEISKAFSSLTGSGLVVMKPSGQEDGGTYSVVPASEEEASHIASGHPSFVNGHGVSYLADFENFFPQLHQAYVSAFGKKLVIQDVSIRTAVDFLWLDESDEDFFPEKPVGMEDDEIVLGLPYDSMAAICLALGILRNYDTLGRYIEVHGLMLVYELENDSWSFTDEQMLRVRAVCPATRPRIYHSNHLWSTYLVETRMRFPASASPDGSKPWMLQKLSYVQRSGDPLSFRRSVRSSNDLDGYVFDVARKEYAPTLYEDGEHHDLGRYYVFLSDRKSLPIEQAEKALSSGYFKGFVYGANGSYLAYPESMMVGFANPFYLSSLSSSIDTVIDSRSHSKIEEGSGEVSLPEKTVVGHYLKPASNCLVISANPSSITSGRFPENLNEIAISEDLNELLGQPSSVYVTTEISSMENDGLIEREMRKEELSVIGYTKEQGQKIEVVDSWALDFFSDVLGMSSFALEPASAVFSCREGVDGTEVALSLSKTDPDYLFVDPSAKVTASVEGTLSYINLGLYGGMGVCLTLALILLLVVAILTIMENEREGRIIYELGLPKSEISNAFGSSLLLTLLTSTLSSSFIMCVLEYAVDKAIKGNFSFSDAFVFDSIPILAIALVSGLSFVLLQSFVIVWTRQRKFVK